MRAGTLVSYRRRIAIDCPRQAVHFICCAVHTARERAARPECADLVLEATRADARLRPRSSRHRLGHALSNNYSGALNHATRVLGSTSRLLARCIAQHPVSSTAGNLRRPYDRLLQSPSTRPTRSRALTTGGLCKKHELSTRTFVLFTQLPRVREERAKKRSRIVGKHGRSENTADFGSESRVCSTISPFDTRP